MHPLIKAPLYGLWKVGIVLVCMALMFWSLFFTNFGAKGVLHIASKMAGVSVSYHAFKGHLAGPLAFEQLTLKSTDADISVENAWVDFNLTSLLIGTLCIEDLKVERVIMRLKASETDKTLSLDQLKKRIVDAIPFHVQINHFTAQSLKIKSKKTLMIDHFSFNHADSDNPYLFNTLSLDGSFGFISINTTDKLNLRWDLNITDVSMWFENATGDLKTQGRIVTEDIKNLKNASLLNASFKTKKLTFGKHVFTNMDFSSKGTFEKPVFTLYGNFNNHKLKATVEGNINSENMAFNLKNLSWSHPQMTQLSALQGKFTLQRGDVLQGTLTLSDKNNIIKGSYSVDTKDEYALEGEFKGLLKDLSFLSKVSPHVGKFKGTADVKLFVGGTLERPQFWGESQCSKIKIPMPRLGTEIELNILELKSDKDGLLTIEGRGKLGKGPFSIMGTSNLREEHPTVNLDIQGSELVVSDTPEFYVLADAKLHLNIENNKPKLTGTVFVPEAKIKLQEISSAVSVSSDVVIVQSKKTMKAVVREPESTDLLTTQITVELGDLVQFKGYGVDAFIKGKVDVHGAPNKPLLAKGKIVSTKGKYHARSKVLNITKGHLIYAETPLWNPVLDIRSEREIKTKSYDSKSFKRSDLYEPQKVKPDQVTVGIALTGTIKAPVIKMYSTPSMPDADALSYLLLDKPQSEASAFEGKLLFEAASEMIYHFGAQKNDVRPTLIEKFHLDTIDVKTLANHPGQSTLEDTVLVIGKQLSRKLYAEYAMGLSDTPSTLHLRYALGNNVVLETSASANSMSADVLFTYESG